MTVKVFVEGSDAALISMFNGRDSYEVTDNFFEADLVCLEGGADVSPELYGQANTYSHTSFSKDISTFGLLAMAAQVEKPVVGICRGHQALAVWHGHKLYQHIGECNNTPHTFTPDYIPMSDKVKGMLDHGVLHAPADHHQMVNRQPYGDGVEVNHAYMDSRGVLSVMVYPEQKDIGFQFHPEWDKQGSASQELFFEMVEDTCFNDPV